MNSSAVEENSSAFVGPATEAQAQSHEPHRRKALLQIAVTRALELLNSGAPTEAVAHLRQSAELALADATGAYVFGLIHFNAAEMPAALQWFERALALLPFYPEALTGQAIVLQRLGRPVEALEAFQFILRLQPDNAEALHMSGVILNGLGQKDSALAAFESALQARPDYWDALTHRGALLEQLGRVDEALACFDKALLIKPEDATSLFNRGTLLQKLGHYEEALRAFEAARQFGAPDPETELNCGNVLQKLGRFEDSLICYKTALTLQPGYPQAFYNQAIAQQKLGRHSDALFSYDDALRLKPDYPEALCNRGNILHELGRFTEAFASYDKALTYDPGFLQALINRATLLLLQGQPEKAIESCDAVLARQTTNAQALCVRSAALLQIDQFDAALAAIETALRIKPLYPEALLNRGNILQKSERLQEAIESYDEALRIKPGYAEVLSGRGVALKELGRLDEALAAFDEALRHKPNFPDARNNRAGALLLTGRLKDGFEDFEARWERGNAPPKAYRSSLPQWRADQPSAGRKIVVWDEQGLGDLIQFCRYLPMIVETGAEVTFLCRRSMQRLLGSLPKSIRLVTQVDPNERFDFQTPLMSLPYAFATSPADIPAPTSYLRSEPELVEKWAERLGRTGFRIGICCHGNNKINLQRSIPSEAFEPIGRIAGVRLINLMKEVPPNTLPLETFDALDVGPDAFIDTAALMESLDLIISSDTSIAHLAGALGRPVFLALKQVPDWRWMMDRPDSPWYPTMRIFRQQETGNWASVFAQMVSAVEEKVGATSSPRNDALAIPAAIGELIDKITILEIKTDRVTEQAKLGNIRRELSLLRKLRAEAGFNGPEVTPLEAELKSVNAILWVIEDELRAHEQRQDFGPQFVALARKVYQTNDRRAALKRQINLLFNSAIVEEKSYSTAT
jgi:tetratricopeptide (TPR) repeat protein